MSNTAIAILMTCHNRRETTLRCLKSLLDSVGAFQGKKQAGAEFHVFLVDDGSTDGTSEAVKGWSNSITSHSSLIALHLIAGDGNLYWARGMALAWREALKYERATNAPTSSFSFDYFLWLNDDVVLSSDALEILLSNLREVRGAGVVVGACCDGSGQCSYGATDAKDHLMTPAGSPIKAGGWFTGNVVLVPRRVSDAVGIIDDSFTHARADYDYAERLKVAGIPFYAASRFVGICTNDWKKKMSGRTLLERIASLWRPGYGNLHDLWLIRSRYHGVCRAVVSCVHMIFIVLRGVK